MAPAATVTQTTQAHPHKKQRPPGILTGINSSTSSPSPSLAAKRLPPSNSHGSGSATSNGNGLRSANRTRRDGSNQLLGRGQRNNRSTSVAAENPTWMELPYGLCTRPLAPHGQELTIYSERRCVYFEEVQWSSPFIDHSSVPYNLPV